MNYQPKINRRAFVIGTAAGLGAVLHSPVAAGVLAVEIPFREGLAWRRLPAAVVGSTVGYFARASMSGFGVPWRTAAGVVGFTGSRRLSYSPRNRI